MVKRGKGRSRGHDPAARRCGLPGRLGAAFTQRRETTGARGYRTDRYHGRSLGRPKLWGKRAVLGLEHQPATADRWSKILGVRIAAPGGDEYRSAGAPRGGVHRLPIDYFPGLGVGVVYGLVRPRLGRIPTLRAGAVLGLAAMGASDGPMVALGVTDPRRCDLDSWISARI